MAIYERHRPESTVLYQSVARAWPQIEIDYAISDQSIQTHAIDINLSGSLASGAAETSLPKARPIALSNSKEFFTDVKDLSEMRVHQKLCGLFAPHTRPALIFCI
jgi:hypothetical protein